MWKSPARIPSALCYDCHITRPQEGAVRTYIMKTAYKITLGLALVVLVCVGGWLAFRSQSDNGLANLSASAKLTDDQVQMIIDRIGKFMVVPSDEKPSVVILRDVAALEQQQPFYRGAKDGDILVVYSTRAIVYDAKTNKLVSVSPIQRNDATPAPIASTSVQFSPSPSVSATPVAPEKVVVDVRNGTSVAGLAGATASDLKKNKWVTIGAVGDAKGAYTGTVLVDLSKGTKPGAVAELERILKTKAVTAIPSGEQASTADVLVIVGK